MTASATAAMGGRTARPLLLAIEDETPNAALLRAALAPAGFDLVVVDTLEAGRTWLSDHPAPDLILLDRHLPDGDGLELVRELRSSPEPLPYPILLVTASVLPDDWQAAAEAGCDAFIPKPIGVRALIDEIVRQLDRSAARSDSTLAH